MIVEKMVMLHQMPIHTILLFEWMKALCFDCFQNYAFCSENANRFVSTKQLHFSRVVHFFSTMFTQLFCYLNRSQVDDQV